ncbi:MAG: DUF2088 domain-containing protein [Fimbriimonadaceae bacterium]|nr:DUF2088 domain-containing protein [Fimbriimonadaceae bacterium]
MLELTTFRQPFPRCGLADPAATLATALASADWPRDLAGRRVAIAVGSRGIGCLPLLVRGVVAAVRQRGGEPWIVPAMGSHGAATAEGQAAVLARLGVTEQTVGAPVRATMETVQLGTTASGVPVHCDAHAAAADGLVLINRIKPHTSFQGHFESGLLKLLAVGLGNHAGAAAVHRPAVAAWGATIAEVGQVALARLPVLLGVALVEDAYHAPALLEALSPPQILEREPQLLDRARELLPRLPFEELDVLVVDELGKDVSGTGLDPNVIGRLGIRGVADPGRPQIRVIVVLDLTAATGGNGLGIGLADLTTAALVRKLDQTAMAANALTTGLPGRVSVPLTCPDAASAVDTAIDLIRDKPAAAVRLAWIRNTRDLAELRVSAALVAEARQRGLEEVVA